MTGLFFHKRLDSINRSEPPVFHGRPSARSCQERIEPATIQPARRDARQRKILAQRPRQKGAGLVDHLLMTIRHAMSGISDTQANGSSERCAVQYMHYYATVQPQPSRIGPVDLNCPLLLCVSWIIGRTTEDSS